MELDLIVDNANIVTSDPRRPRATRLGVWQGRVVGLDDQLHGLGAVERVDLRGRTLVPGFNDAHCHSVWFGQTLMDVDLQGARTAEDVYAAVAARAATLGSTEWVVCCNYNPLLFPGQLPDRDQLDAAASGRPVLIKHGSGHAYTVNGAALGLARVEEHPTRQPDGGEIVTDANGRATGVLDETAMSVIQDLLMPESIDSIVQALDLATSRYVQEGLTSVTDAGIAGGWIGHAAAEFAAYQRARDEARLSTRVQAMITSDVLHALESHPQDPQLHTLDAGIRSGVGDEWLQIGPAKVFTDGSLLGATAAMTEEYAHCRHHFGYLQMDAGEMRDRVMKAAASGWSLALHAIGDAAIDFAVDAIAEAVSRHGPRPMPHRIEHGGVVRPDQVARMARTGVVLVPQPHFIPSYGDGMARKLGPGRADLSYPARRLLEAGMTLPGSSDRPVAEGHPLRVIQAFVERRTESGKTYGEADRITAEQALHAYTAGSAAATGWAGRKGQLIEGQLADFVVLSDDPLTVPTRLISQLDVEATVIGGTLAHGKL